nr:hypothetical protein [Tanacetum cinerariifolium]
MDEALVPSTQRLRIGRSNFRLPTDIESKESTLQLIYDVLRRCPFFKAFLVTADVPEIYMQEFWATAYLHQHSIRFKMNNKKHILDLESFRNMLHICTRVQSQTFAELPFEEEILDFIRNIDYAFLIWEDFVYQVEHKNHKKSSEMYYPRFTKVIIHHFMSKDPSIPRRNKYDAMLPIELTNDEIRNTKAYKEYYAFATREVVPKPKASARRKRSESVTSITPPTTTPTSKPTVAATPKLTAAAKGKQPAKATKAKNEGTGSKPGVLDVPTDESEEELSWNSSDDKGADDQVNDGDDDEEDEGDESDEGEEDADEDKDGDERDDDEANQETAKYDEQDDAEGGGNDKEEGESDEEDDNEETREEESFDPIPKTPKGSEDEGDGEEDQGLNVNKEEHVEEDEEDELYRDVNINQGRGLQATLKVEDTHVTLTPINSDGQQESSSVSSQFVTSMLNPTSDVGMESIFETASSSVAPLHTSTPIMTLSTISTITTISQAPIPPTPILSEVFQNLPTFALVFRFDDRLKSLEDNFSEYRQTNPFVEAVSAIPGIVDQYMNQQMNEASVNAQLEAEVLTRSSHSSRTSYAVAIDLSEMKLKKILIEKIEGNKSIQRSDEQKNLYKALVDAYEADKIILDSYGETVILERRRDDDDDDDKDEGTSAGSDQGSKRQRKGKEPGLASAPLETATRSAGRSTTGSKSRQASVRESAFTEEPPQKPPTPDHDWNKTLSAVQGSTQTWISKLAKQADSRSSFIELLDTPLDFSNFIMNRLRVYKFKEGDFKRLRLQDIEDMLLLLVQGKLSNLTVEERFAFNVSLGCSQEASSSSDMEAYTAYLNPREFIYQNKDKKNRLMRIDELHKFSNGTLNDVRTALDDRLKGIRMQYLPQTIWRKGDKDRATAMIQAIDKMLKTRRILRSLEKFVGGRLEIVTYWFTLIVLSALRHAANENTLSLTNLILRALRGSELNYTSMEKLVMALVHASKRLKRYFQAHPIIVITDQPIQQILSRPEVVGRLQKWSIKLEGYAIHYRPRVSVKGHILADFIVERPKEDSPDTPIEEEGELPEPWILFTNGSSYTDGSGAGLILTNPEGMEFTYALRFRFDATKNEAKYEALIAGLRIAEQMGVKNLQANIDSRLVANQVNGTYVAKEANMIRYLKKVKALTGSFKAFSIKQIPRSENKKADALIKIVSTSFAHLNVKKARAIKRKSWRFAVVNETLYKKSFFGPWLRCVGPLQANYVLREIHEGDARTLIRACQDCQVYKPVSRNPQQKLTPITSSWTFYKFGLPREIISDNRKQFRDDPFKDWCEKLCIRKHFAFVKHSQTNGLVERANRSLGEGIKVRFDARSKNWIEEIPHVLWAHCTMIKSSNRDTSFSLTYETEAVILAKIGMPTLRTAEVDLVGNNAALEINLDLLEERREEAAIREAKRKLGPKWEGPYEVTEALGKGAYKLRGRDGKQLLRTWNISNLKKCHIHKM